MTPLSLRNRLRGHWPQLWRFAIAGGTGAIVDFSFLNLGVILLHLDPRISNIFSTLISSLVVFFLNKYFAFRSRTGKVSGQALRFVLTYALAYVLNVCFTTLFITIGLHFFPSIAAAITNNVSKALAIGVVMFWNYALLHSFVFKKEERVVEGV